MAMALRVVGWLVFAFGLVEIAAAAYGILSGRLGDLVGTMVAAAFFGAVALGGWGLTRWANRIEQRRRTEADGNTAVGSVPLSSDPTAPAAPKEGE